MNGTSPNVQRVLELPYDAIPAGNPRCRAGSGRGRRPRAVGRRMLCFCSTLVLCLMSQSNACEQPAAEARVAQLGYGEFVIGLPPGWHISAGTVVMELAAYSVTRKDGFEALNIALSSSPSRQYLGTSARPYCTNGLRGESETKDGKTRIRLDIPPSPDESQRSDTAAYVEFRAGDADAAMVVASARVPWVTGRCPDAPEAGAGTKQL